MARSPARASVMMAPLMALGAALALAGCGQPAPEGAAGDAETQAAETDPVDDFLDGLIAEIESGELDQAFPSASAWNELPLPDGVFHEYAEGWRTDRIEIPLAAHEWLEYKLTLNAGDAIVYSWQAGGLPDAALLWTEFHGHTEAPPGEMGDLMFYRMETGDRESGALIAPFTGIHGWYLENRSDADIIVTLDVAGFYENAPGRLP